MTKIIFTHEVRSNKRFVNKEKLAAASGKFAAAIQEMKAAEKALAEHVYQKPTDFRVELSLEEQFGCSYTLLDLNNFAQKYNINAQEMRFLNDGPVEVNSQLFAEKREQERFNSRKNFLTKEVERRKSLYELASKELEELQEKQSDNGIFDVSYIAKSARNIKKILNSNGVKSDVFSNESKVMIVLFEKHNEIHIPDFGIEVKIVDGE